MPELSHYDGFGRFDINESAVVRWLIAQPDVKQWIFGMMKARHLIRFDSSKRTWQGVKE
jgi:hypothetical protein